jgi:CHASE2 domain-containing sensor protein
MAKALFSLFPLLIAASAFAQSTGAEAPAEKANPFTVVIFLVLFVGGCAGYFVYLWWSQRKIRLQGEGKGQQ